MFPSKAHTSGLSLRVCEVANLHTFGSFGLLKDENLQILNTHVAWLTLDLLIISSRNKAMNQTENTSLKKYGLAKHRSPTTTKRSKEFGMRETPHKHKQQKSSRTPWVTQLKLHLRSWCLYSCNDSASACGFFFTPGVGKSTRTMDIAIECHHFNRQIIQIKCTISRVTLNFQGVTT